MIVRNDTGHAHGTALLYDARGREVLVVVVKATVRLGTGERLDPIPVLRGDALFPSGAVRYPADFALEKAGTDVVCHATARAPHGIAVERFDVELAVGPLRRRARVLGARTWTRRGGDLVPSDPEPFAELPLGFEHAFGGRDGERVFEENPIGTGFWDPGARDDPEGVALPRIEDEDALIGSPEDRPLPAGFGAIPGRWRPRLAWAGTCDERWERTRAPLLPDDFDARFFDAALPGMTTERPLVGGEPLELVNLGPDGSVFASIPRVHVRIRVGSAWRRPQLDRVVIEPDEDRVALTYRASIDVTGRIERLPRVTIVERSLAPLGAA